MMLKMITALYITFHTLVIVTSYMWKGAGLVEAGKF